jgi:hypothetical protein
MQDRLSLGLEEFCNAHQARTPEGAIRGAWQRVVDSLKLRPPISLRPVCDALGVSVHWKNQPNLLRRGNASLSVESGRLTIRVHTPNVSLWRYNRFLVGHELTHALIIQSLRNTELVQTLDATKKDYNSLEQLCDLGAHELLMPSAEFRMLMSSHELGPDLIRLLHDRFLVTLASAADRLAYLTPRGALLRLRKHARSSEETIEWRVISSFPRYQYHSIWPWLPKGATLKHLPGVSDLDSLSLSDSIMTGRTKIQVSSRAWIGDYTAFAQPHPRTEQNKQPIFEHFIVPDEPEPRHRDILLFIREADAKTSQ